MRTSRKIVQTNKVYAHCKSCDGVVVPTGRVIDKNPFSPKGMDLRMKPLYEHVCSQCNRKVKLDRSYPHIEYKEV